MKQYRVSWQPVAREDLANIYRWIAVNADPATARAYTHAIEIHAAALADYPELGRPRSDLGPGIRSLPYKRRVLIAYRFQDNLVEILRVAYAGRTLELA